MSNEARANHEELSNEARGNRGEMTNEQLVIRIKAGEDVAGNMAGSRQTGNLRLFWALA